MKLLVEEISDPVYSSIVESADGTKHLYMEGTMLRAEHVNRNKRKYSKKILKREADRYITEWVNTNRALGELNHPERPNVDPKHASHRIVSLNENGNDWVGRVIIINSNEGKTVKALHEAGTKLGFSSRGAGTMTLVNGINEINSDYKLCTAADLVLDPSAEGAFANALMESADWVLDAASGNWQLIEELQKDIKSAKSRQLESKIIASFGRFINSL